MIPSFFILPMMAESTAFCSATNSAGRVFYGEEWLYWHKNTYLLLGLSEKLALALLTVLLGSLGLLESGISDLVELNGRDVQLSRSLDDICTVDSSQGNTVDLEGA